MSDSRQQLARNTAWNLLGNGTPILAAVLCIPVLIKGLGADRFGILTLVWMVIGYFSFFDLGIGRSTTKIIAERLSSNDLGSLPSIFWNSIILLGSIGLLIGGLALLLLPKLAHRFVNMPADLVADAQRAFRVLSFSLPLVLVATGVRGALEGAQYFKALNAVKIPTNVALVAAPLLVLPFSHDLYPVVLVLVISRGISLFFYLYVCVRSLPVLKQYAAPTLTATKELVTFGGWLTLTNIIGALIAMGYIDRMMISSFLSVKSVTYYVTPFEIISRLWIFPYSLMGVLFPVFTACMVTERDRLPDLHRSALTYVTFVLTPIILATLVLAKPFLTVWIGADFAVLSARVLQVFSIGVLANAVAQVPFTIIQSIGRPDLTAKRHMWELPFYILIMWWGITRFGILGAALTWLLWSVLDMLILLWLTRRLLNDQKSRYLPQHSGMTVAIVVGCIAAAFGASSLPNVLGKMLSLLVLLPGIVIYTWKFVMDHSDKDYVMSRMRRTI